MAKEIKQVEEFHKVFEHPIGDVAKALSIKRGLDRAEYIKSEVYELIEAVESEDVVEQVDACIDIIYFALGTLVELGVADKFEALFAEVQRSNMSKVCVSIESAMKTAENYGKLADIKAVEQYWKVSDTFTHKIVKSDTYSKPDLKSIIDA